MVSFHAPGDLLQRKALTEVEVANFLLVGFPGISHYAQRLRLGGLLGTARGGPYLPSGSLIARYVALGHL